MKKIPTYAALFAAAIIPLHAASDLTNPLNTYLGNSQANQPGQPAFLSSSLLEVSSIPATATAVQSIDFFDASAVLPATPGIQFGNSSTGDTGRNYIRTVAQDYHTRDFTAYITVNRPRNSAVSPAINNPAVFFGLGTAARAGNGNSPDRTTANASVFLELQSGFNNASRRVTGDGSLNAERGFQAMNPLPSYTQDRVIRIRMRYDSTLSTVAYALDYDYDANLGFQEDQKIEPTNTSPSAVVNVSTQVSEWYAGDRASIYFGGDRKVVFTDFVVEVNETSKPPTPTGLLIAEGDSFTTLTWNDLIPTTTYSVYRSIASGNYGVPPVPIATGITGGTFTDTTVTNDTPYFYVITQTNDQPVESDFSAEVSATPTGGPVIPTGVLAANGGNAAIVIDWSDLSPNIFQKYTVYRSATVDGTFVALGDTTVSRFTDETGIANGTPYFYRVTSTRNSVESAPTAPVSAQARALEVFVDFNAAGVPPTPTFSGAGAVTPAPVGTSWNGIAALGLIPNLTDSTSNLSSVGLNATGQGIFSAGNGLNVGGDNSTPGSATLTGPGGFALMQDYVFQNNASTVTYTLTGLIPGRKYDLYLYGYGDVLGQNTLFGVNGVLRQTSSPAGLTTLTEGRHYVSFSAEATVDGTVVFTWRNGFGSTDADASSGSGLLNGFQLVENETAVLQPTGLSASNSTSGVTLSWNEVEATDYKIYRSTTRASGYTLVGSSGGNSNFIDTTGNPGTTYYYVVTGVNVVPPSTFESFFSGEVSGMKAQLIIDADLDGLSDADEALIGTNPNDAADFFKAQTSSVTPNGANYNVSFTINGAPGTYVIERSTTLLSGSWTTIPSSQQTLNWTTGTVLTNPLSLSATALAPAPGGKEFFRARGIAPLPAP